ncbi:MAG: UbiA family prenyltransferase [Planctomycetota bacterium]
MSAFAARVAAAPVLRHILLLRPHHWVKNTLVFAVPLTSHLTEGYGPVVLGFFSFCLVASAVYVCNDLLDSKLDRRHPKKRFRPLAAGTVSSSSAIVLGLVCLGSGTALAVFVGWSFAGFVAAYLILSCAYSFGLRRMAVVDVFVLATLFGLRAFSGGIIVDVKCGEWFLTFCAFLFLSLGFLKRYVELRWVQESGEGSEKFGRGYRPDDLFFLQALGLICAVSSGVVLCLYLSSDVVDGLYGRKGYLWFAAPLYLFWTTRIWFLANRGTVDHDPIAFAFRDRGTHVIAAACFLLVYLAAS